MIATIQTQIETSQRGEGADPWEHYRRGALVDLDRMGFTTIQQASLGFLHPDDYATDSITRYRAWADESLVWAIGRIRDGHPSEALRGFIQVIDYSARAYGPFAPAWLSDAMGALRNYFEKLLKNRLSE